MKKRIFALAGACLLTLAACGGGAALPHPGGPGPIDEECPRADGQPCR